MILGWILGLIGLAMSGISILCLVNGSLLPAALAHVLAALCGAGGAVMMRDPDTRGRPAFEIVLALCVPCVGGVLAWLHAAGQRAGRSAHIADDFAEYIDASMRLGEQKLPEVRVAERPNPEFLAPMADVLNSGASEDDKRIAVEALTRLETPAAIRALQNALTNESTEVRFYAASALEKLEERLQMRLKTLEEHVSEGGRTDPAAEIETARTCYDYAYYQVVDTLRRRQYLERAVTHATRAAERGGDPSAWVVAGRALLELDRYDEAEAAFTKHLDAAGESVKVLLWRAEARFFRHDYAGVHTDCSRAEQLGHVPDPMKEAVAMWA